MADVVGRLAQMTECGHLTDGRAVRHWTALQADPARVRGLLAAGSGQRKRPNLT